MFRSDGLGVRDRAILPPGLTGVHRILGRRDREVAGHVPGVGDPPPGEEEDPVEIDPVCGMEVDPTAAEWKTRHEGKEFFFCSKGCLEDFLEEPSAYLG